ncbi:MAG: hypothetical protein GX445_01740 [Elusimicrobia bacterium]|nr:hypothetical protein [Elusimicrobiota bacterium]
MEKAIVVSSYKNLLEEMDGYDIIYLGDEFCPNFITLDDLLKLKNIRKKKVFLTPMVTDREIQKIISILDFNKKNILFDEITINDIGLLKYIYDNKIDIKINIGRILLLSLSSSITSNYFINMFKKLNISSFEIDSADHLKYINNLKNKISLHTPYRYITMTRFCPSAKNRWIKDCRNRCSKRYMLLQSKLFGNIFINGNAYFYRDEPLLTDTRITRIIESK